MSAEYEDRVQETTVTTGTGTLTLGGAVAGFRTFASAFSNGDRVSYTLAGVIGGVTEWESGEGIFSSGTLTRVNVFRSSNSNALVSLSAGTHAVWCGISGASIIDFGLSYAFQQRLVNQ